MGFNLRGAILHNVHGNSSEQLESTIVDAISNGEEKMLPGLGVLFEVIWKNASETERDEMVEMLHKGVQ